MRPFTVQPLFTRLSDPRLAIILPVAVWLAMAFLTSPDAGMAFLTSPDAGMAFLTSPDAGGNGLG